MKNKILLSVLIVFAGLILRDSLQNQALTYSSGAPAGYCGSPDCNYLTCTSCHFGDSAVYIPDLITADVPVGGYIPGDTFNIRAGIAMPGHLRFGFEVGVQDSAGNVQGTLVDTSSRSQITDFGRFITHSYTGTHGTDSLSWDFRWVAPVAGTGDVYFWGAFNVTNNSSTNVGDSIYISTLVINENQSVGVNSKLVEGSINVFPNPVADNFYLTTTSDLRHDFGLNLFDISGKPVILNIQRMSPTPFTTYHIELPNELPTGIYFLVVNSGNSSVTKKIMISQNN